MEFVVSVDVRAASGLSTFRDCAEFYFCFKVGGRFRIGESEEDSTELTRVELRRRGVGGERVERSVRRC